jgi:hypothetical protein
MPQIEAAERDGGPDRYTPAGVAATKAFFVTGRGLPDGIATFIGDGWAGCGEVLQDARASVEEISMSRCHQCGGYGHRAQPAVPHTPPPPLVSTQTLMCARCGDPLDGHLMFSGCFPHGYLKESSLLLHRVRLIAV